MTASGLRPQVPRSRSDSLVRAPSFSLGSLSFSPEFGSVALARPFPAPPALPFPPKPESDQQPVEDAAAGSLPAARGSAARELFRGRSDRPPAPRGSRSHANGECGRDARHRALGAPEPRLAPDPAAPGRHSPAAAPAPLRAPTPFPGSPPSRPHLPALPPRPPRRSPALTWLFLQRSAHMLVPSPPRIRTW